MILELKKIKSVTVFTFSPYICHLELRLQNMNGRGAMIQSFCVCLVAQSCPTLCDPMDYSPPGSSVHRGSPGKNAGVGCHDRD